MPVAGARDDALGHLALEHQCERVEPRRPVVGRQPPDQERGADIVGQVGDDPRRTVDFRTRIDPHRVALDDFQPAAALRDERIKRLDAAMILLDGDDLLRPVREQRARQAARSGSDLDHGDAVERPRRPRDAVDEIEIEQEILAERFLGAQVVFADDVAERQ